MLKMSAEDDKNAVPFEREEISEEERRRQLEKQDAEERERVSTGVMRV